MFNFFWRLCFGSVGGSTEMLKRIYLLKPIKPHRSRGTISCVVWAQAHLLLAPTVHLKEQETFAYSFCLCSCFVSGSWPHSVLTLVCTRPLYYPIDGSNGGLVLQFDSVVICIEMGICLLSGRGGKILCLFTCPHQLRKYFVHINKENSFCREKLVSLFLFWPVAQRDYVCICVSKIEKKP